MAQKALAESSSPEASLEALLALTQASARDPAHREKDEAAPDTKVRDQILAALARLDWDKLDYARQLDLVRVYQVVLNRFPPPTTPRLPSWPQSSSRTTRPRARAEHRACAVDLLLPDAGRRSKDIGAVGQGADARRADSIRQRPPRLDHWLDPRIAQGVFRLVPEGGRLQRRQQLPRLHEQHQEGRHRPSERRGEEGVRSAGRCQAGRIDRDSRRSQSPAC